LRQHTHLGVYGIIRRHNAILLIRKARGPYTGRFDLPGGRIEFGEAPEEALTREIAEETGLCIYSAHAAFCDSVCFTHSVTDNGTDEELHHIGIIYEVTVTQDAAIKTSADGLDSNGAFWFDPAADDMKNLTPFAYKAITGKFDTLNGAYKVKQIEGTITAPKGFRATGASIGINEEW